MKFVLSRGCSDTVRTPTLDLAFLCQDSVYGLRAPFYLPSTARDNCRLGGLQQKTTLSDINDKIKKPRLSVQRRYRKAMRTTVSEMKTETKWTSTSHIVLCLLSFILLQIRTCAWRLATKRHQTNLDHTTKGGYESMRALQQGSAVAAIVSTWYQAPSTPRAILLLEALHCLALCLNAISLSDCLLCQACRSDEHPILNCFTF